MDLQTVDKPTKWPNANAQLLGLGQGLPVHPLDRLNSFSADEFERFVLEWAQGYLSRKVPDVYQVQQRGGAGDKGRDIVVWFGAPDDLHRHWHLHQCKRYGVRLGPGPAAAELAKVLYFAARGDYTLPSRYWFVTLKGVTGDLQDLVDTPEKLKAFVIKHWDKYCADRITSTHTIALEGELRQFVEATDFAFVRVKQPLELIDEHRQTDYHALVFGGPLVDRPRPPEPPSLVAAKERRYVGQLFDVIGELTGQAVASESDFNGHRPSVDLYSRSRISFYSAEGLKELARDNMDWAEFFDDLLGQFRDGLYHTYVGPAANGLARLSATVRAAQAQQIPGHVLERHMTPLDREGVCHHLANDGSVAWCDDD